MKYLITILNLCVFMPIYGQVNQEWVQRYNGLGNSSDEATSIAVDVSGNVYVTGRSYSSGSSFDYATVKYDANGNQQWIQLYNGPSNSRDEATSIAVDVSGNVYVTGRSVGSSTSDDYATVKYDANGNQQWVQRYNGLSNSTDQASSVTVDVSGNVYVTGWSYISGRSYDYATVKYDTNGNQQWVQLYNGPSNSTDQATSIAVDVSGNVHVTGWSVGSGTRYDYATVKYDTNGNQLWVRPYNGPVNWNDYATSIAVDVSGNVYVTGSSGGSGGGFRDDYATVKYDANGNQQWVQRYNGPSNRHDRASSIAVDISGNVYVTGSSGGSFTRDDYATVKYDANGNQQWVQRYNGPFNSVDRATSIAVDVSGNVYVTGWSYIIHAGNYDYATVKYDTNGSQQWVQRYNEPSNNIDVAESIAVDVSGNVYVTGRSYGGTSYDYATIKYSQSIQDDTPPVFSGLPADLPGPVSCDAVPSAPTVTANDDVDGAVTVSFNETITSGACANTYTITRTWTATDAAGNTATASQTINVVDETAPTIAGVPTEALVVNTIATDAVGCGVAVTFPVITATDNCDGAVTLTYKVGETTVSSGDVFNVGTTTLTVIATDVCGNESTENFDITVVDAEAPIVVVQDITVELDSSGNASIVAVDIDNGSNDACGISSLSIDKTTFDCSHVGANTVTLTVTDNNGNVSTATATVTVEDNIAPEVYTKDLTVKLDISGLASITPEQINNGSTDACGIASYALDISTFDCLNVGMNTVTLSVTDVNGNVGTATATVTVENDLPEITSLSLPIDPQQINATVNAVASFVDMNPSSATFDWGDGFNSSGAIGAGNITGSHQYSMSGVYTITVTLTDICGETDIEIYQYVVVYDPSGGFVTGGGWINSPFGASVEYPDAVGKASFGFVSKYKKGAHVPDGNTVFQFKSGDLKFKSTSYEWLVVAGSKAKFKGDGTINGTGNYGFMLTCTDNSNGDMFRIKIWDKLNNDVVVYDNQMGSTDDSYIGTLIGGGSIVVHDGKSKGNKREGLDGLTVENKIQGVDYFDEVSVYPNPFNNYINISLTQAFAEKNEIGVYLFNSAGIEVINQKTSTQKLSEIRIDINNLARGVYVLMIENGLEIVSFKLTK